MIQLIDILPFGTSDIQLLKDQWKDYKAGQVNFDRVPDAVCGEYSCEAEMQVNDSGFDSGHDTDSDTDTDQHELLKYLPSGHGKLIITVSKLYWISSDEDRPTVGWSVDYQHILLHAISKPAPESRPYIYLQLSCNKVYDPLGNEISLGAEGEKGEESKFVEVNLYLEEGVAAVDEVFVGLSECASLYPCDESEEGESEGDGSEIESGDNTCDDDSSDDSRNSKKNKLDAERFEDAAEK